MRYINVIIYYLISSKLPTSFLPFGAIFNFIRVYNLKGIITIGSKCTIQRNVYIGFGKNVKIGKNCQINDNVRLSNVHIGDNVMIARDCIFLGSKHLYSDKSKPMNVQGEVNCMPTVIESDVWIGARSIIMPNLFISSGTIVGAGSVLTKNTVTNGIYGGVPAKLIKLR